VKQAQLRRDLEAIAEELMVDLSLTEPAHGR
jgi:glycine cleavage system regulatory protein